MNRNNTPNSPRNHPSQTRHCAAYARAFQKIDESLAQNSDLSFSKKIKLLDLLLFGAEEAQMEPSGEITTPNAEMEKSG
jgi:hypothetical protein